MKRTWTIIGVADVAASFKWYQSLFDRPETSPGHDHFGQIFDSDGTVLLCLHSWGAHEHPTLMSPDEATPGNGAQIDNLRTHTFENVKVGPNSVVELRSTATNLEFSRLDSVEVTVKWGTQVMCIKHLSAGQGFSLGEGGDFVMPEEALGASKVDIVRAQGDMFFANVPGT